MAEKTIRGDSEVLPEDTGRHAAHHQDDQEDEGDLPLEKENTEERIHFFITARRVRIDPVAKREQYINRLERLLVQLDNVISSSEVSQKLKLRVMNVLISTVRTCYGIVSEIELEGLENEFTRITEENQRSDTERLEYYIEEYAPE